MKENKPEIPGFELIECCGKGASASVWWAIDADGFRRAIRIIDRRNTPPDLLEKERHSIAAYRNAARQQPNLIEILYIGDTDKYIYYVMPLADSAFPAQCRYTPMTLAIKLQRERLSADEITDIFGTLLDAVAVLHRNGLSHHDLKPENIIFVDGVLKIADPGLAMDVNVKSYSGSPNYKSDFMISGNKCDIYALGKILYCMYTNFPVERFPELPQKLALTDPFFDFNMIALKCCEHRNQYESIEDIQCDWEKCKKLSSKCHLKKKLWKYVPYFLIAVVLIGVCVQIAKVKIPALKAISIQIYVVGDEHFTGKD